MGRVSLGAVEIAAATDAVETISVSYAGKFGLERTDVWFMLKLQEEVGELVQAFVAVKGMSRDKSATAAELRRAFSDECADVLAHVLLLARHEGVDLEAALADKWLQWA